MASFVVMEPPGEPGASDRATFVRDGFHVFAFLLPVVWFAVHRAWLAALAALVVGIAAPSAAGYFGFPGSGAALVLVASLWFGLEAGNLRVKAMSRRGWREAGVVEAERVAEAEIRYLADVPEPVAVAPVAGGVPLMPVAPAPHAAPGTMPVAAQPWGTAPRPAVPSGPALGLFGYPGRR